MPTIMGNLKNFIRSMTTKAKQAGSTPSSMDNTQANAVFRFKYTLFKELLAANSELFNILSDMEEKLKGNHIFGASYVKTQVIRALIQSFKMVKNLNVLSQNKYPLLYDVLDNINQNIKSLVNERKEQEPDAFVLPYSKILKEDADWVGGKSANIGEIQNRLTIPVPRGFAITAKAYATFLDQNNLREEILKKNNSIDPENITNIELLNCLSAEVKALIQSRPVPDRIMADILLACEKLSETQDSEERNIQNLRVAMRSSAIGEDGELSFAGQYLTLLNVSPDQMEDAYKSIIASLFSARSISYRIAKGIMDDDLSMAVACVKMVDSVASGVMYTRHPYDIVDEAIIITAVWGLGPYAVDGIIQPDTYVVEKKDSPVILRRGISEKAVQLVCNHDAVTGADVNIHPNPAEGIMEIPVPLEKRSVPCLDDDMIRQLAFYGMQLETHYQCAQDIEWALDPSGKIMILQSRPLKINATSARTGSATGISQRPSPVKGYRVIIEKTEIASRGIGAGKAYHVKSDRDLAAFPKNAILIAHHSSPEYVVVMRQCSGMITESGSISGHMAALAREFNVPTLMGLGAKNALRLIPQGTDITVDGYAGRIYEGCVKELVSADLKQGAHMKGTPVYALLESVTRLMTPLNLINPKAPDFMPSGCKTMHDIGRFCHELSYEEMFSVSDIASKQHQCSFRLQAPLPIDLHIIDLGSGIKSDGADKVCGGMISINQIQSIPFLALLNGMLHPEVNCLEPRPVSFSGLLSVMQEQMLSPGHLGGRFGDRSYAIIADKYLNFSSRVGYHYSVIDAYCGDTINKNYISFSFKGGAADDIKKNRRVRSIAMILESLNFMVDVKEDKVDARLQKYSCTIIQDRLDLLGRLLLFTRQMDMLMTTENSMKWVADNFIAGNYKLSAE